MEKSIKIILVILIALFCIQLISSFFGNSNLNLIKNQLKEAQKNSDTIMIHLDKSLAEINSLNEQLAKSKNDIQRLSTSVDLRDTEIRLRETKNKTIRDSLDKRKTELFAELQHLKADSTLDITIKQ
jgi:predicted nuclease with TOPRIM domain